MNPLAAQGLIADFLIDAGATGKLRRITSNRDDTDVKKHVSRAENAIFGSFVDLTKFVNEIDSPIEQVMFGLLCNMYIKNRGIWLDWEDLESAYIITTGNDIQDCINILHQAPVGPYRVDFLLRFWSNHNNCHTLIVECDGHDFHEKTKVQAARDKKRDRYLQQSADAVLHFTGSEIYNNPFDCLMEIEVTIEKIIEKASK